MSGSHFLEMRNEGSAVSTIFYFPLPTRKIIGAMKMHYLLLLSFMCWAASPVLAGEKMHIVSISPDKRFAIVVENWDPPGTPESEQSEDSKTYLIDASTKEKLNCLEDVAGDVSATWNKQSDGVIVFYHFSRLSGSCTLKAKRNQKGEKKLVFSEIVFPDLEKSLPPGADSEGGTWYFRSSGWTPDGDLTMTALIGDNAGNGHVDPAAGGYELILRIDKNNKVKVIKVIRVKPTR